MRWISASAVVLASLALAACNNPSPLEPSGGSNPSSPGGSSSSGSSSTGSSSSGGSSATGGAAGGSGGSGLATGSGTSAPGSAPDTIIAVDPAVFAATVTGSVTTTGTASSLVFRTSGAARYNVGTCTGSVAQGTDGTWIDGTGTASAPHNPNCIDYWTDGRVGLNGKGQCTVTSPEGYIGLWLNPQLKKTSAYHSNCLKVGAPLPSLTISFSASGTVYDANDGSGRRILNLSSGGTAQAQLVYQGTAAGYTTGAGVLSGSDNGSPAGTWYIDFSQSALNWTTGVTNGDMIAALESGVPVIACTASTGCALVTLQLVVGP